MVPVLALGMYLSSGKNVALAKGMMNDNLTPDEIAQKQNSIFEDQANLLGITVNEVKQAWAEGKDIFTLAKEKGISEDALKQKMKDLREQEMKSKLQILVDKGIITQDQADARLKSMQNIKHGKRHFKQMRKAHDFEGF